MDGIENPFSGMFNPFIAAREKEKQKQLEQAAMEAELFRYAQVTILRWTGVPRLDVFVDLVDFPNAMFDTEFMCALELTVKRYVLLSPPVLDTLKAYADWLNDKHDRARACDARNSLDICFVPHVVIKRQYQDSHVLVGILIRKRTTVLAENESTGVELEAPWLPMQKAPRTGEHVIVLGRSGGFGYTDAGIQDWCDVVHWFQDPELPGWYASDYGCDQSTPFDTKQLRGWMKIPHAVIRSNRVES